MAKKLISETTVRQALRRGEALVIGPGDIVTPSARDLIRSSNIPLQSASDSVVKSAHLPLQTRIHRKESEVFAGRKTIAIGSDHGGFPMKELIREYVVSLGFDVVDYGCDSPERTDYPIYAAAVAKAVAKGSAFRGIIVDGAGIGSAITANKFKGIRAAMAYDTLTANNCREHNDANVLSLGGLLLGVTTVKEIVKIFLTTEYDRRHQNRIDMIESIEADNFKS